MMLVCAGCGQIAAFMYFNRGNDLCERCARDEPDPGAGLPALAAIAGGPTGHDEDTDPVGEAYRRVADGFRHGLDVSGLPVSERARLVRCLRHATQKAGVSPLALAGATT